MSGLTDLQNRLKYRGGGAQGRMKKDKLNSLKKALLYSYQSATIVFQNKEDKIFNREFLALINQDKNKNDYDNKILSIPYEDIQLNMDRIGTTTQGQVKTMVATGDVFYWKETDSYWIIYLQQKEEKAYFMAEIRRCEKFVEINKNKYWVYYRGPVETTTPWNQKAGITWNDMNYTSIIYITKNEETLDFFHRFAEIKIDGKPWEVKAVDANSGDGIIEVQLRETFSNSIKDQVEEEENMEPVPEPPEESDPQIMGDTVVYPFDIKEYFVENASEGKWYICDLDKNENNEWVISKKAKILQSDDIGVKIEITSSKSGYFNLVYITEDSSDIVLTIEIDSL